ncbi:MAG TPA: PPOX class F420-dependent oxidoreductase [Phototrophicaceae bacterium]|jgi:hypothetical protein|nr:PPOX class F420-dependent oxidoreductase [Phototrophicaceae bacterium]
MLATPTFEAFANHHFLNLKTYRKSGDPMLTPVWFVQDGDKLYVTTRKEAGKAKRIVNNDTVEVAPCDHVGGLLGEWYQAQARILIDSADRQAAKNLLNGKYGDTETMQKVMPQIDETHVFIEISSRA